MVPRNESGQIVSTKNTGILKMYDLHKQMQINMQEGTQLPSNATEQYELEVEKGVRERSTNAVGATSANQQKYVQLLVEYKVAMFSVGEPTELFFSLWSEKLGVLTEEFVVTLTDKGMPERIDQLGEMRTVFVGINRQEIAEDLCLVCRLYRSGGLHPVDRGVKKKATKPQDAKYRRPFGCSVFPLARCRVGQLLPGQELELTEPIYSPLAGNEGAFHKLHSAIQRGAHSEFDTAPRSNGVVVGVRLFEQDQEDDTHTALLLKTPVTMRLTLPVGNVDINNVRNDFYVTLRGPRGEFAQVVTTMMHPMCNCDAVCDAVCAGTTKEDGQECGGATLRGVGHRYSTAGIMHYTHCTHYTWCWEQVRNWRPSSAVRVDKPRSTPSTDPRSSITRMRPTMTKL
jgi:hypothetical protein